MSIETVSIVVTVVVSHFLALVSPGPDFLMVVRSALLNSKRNAIGVALGIACANGAYIALCILGVASILAASLWVMTALKVLGGMFLIYIAVAALRSKKSDYDFVAGAGIEGELRPNKSFRREFVAGFASGISNPKNILFYLSLFSVVLTNDIGTVFKVGLGIWMTLLVFVWNAVIILALTQAAIRRSFGRMAFYVDKVAGGVLGLVGLKLVHSAVLEDVRA